MDLIEINQINLKSWSQNDNSFTGLKTYEFKEISVDVVNVLKCMPAAQVETPNEVLENFVRPFISIPIDVLMECAKYETVMIPFMQIVSENISNTKDCSEEEWNKILLLLGSVFRGSQNLSLLVSTINILLIVALEKNNHLAQALLAEIMGSVVSNSQLSQQIAIIIEKQFFSYQGLLISILEGIQYPLEIRDVLNDY